MTPWAFLFMAEAFICKDQHYELMSSIEQTIIHEFNLDSTASIDPPHALHTGTASERFTFPLPIDYFIINAIQNNRNYAMTTPYPEKVLSSFNSVMFISNSHSANRYDDIGEKYVYITEFIYCRIQYNADARMLTLSKSQHLSLNASNTSIENTVTVPNNLTVTCEFLVKYSA